MASSCSTLSLIHIFPHLEDVDQVAGGREVVGRRGDAVVEARAHQCAGHGDERGVENLVEGAAVPLPTCGEDPYGHADADQDADRVHVDLSLLHI